MVGGAGRARTSRLLYKDEGRVGRIIRLLSLLLANTE